MLKRYFKRLLAKNKDFFIQQGVAAKGFMHILFKHRNTGEKWTKEDKILIKQHLKTMAKAIPALIVFLPPGGSIFLPILVDIMDRRKTIRVPDGTALPQSGASNVSAAAGQSPVASPPAGPAVTPQ